MTSEDHAHAVPIPAPEAEWLPPRAEPAGTLTGAEDDWAAARHFLNEYRASPETQRRYATEIGRLFLWAERGLGKSPSALSQKAFEPNPPEVESLPAFSGLGPNPFFEMGSSLMN